MSTKWAYLEGKVVAVDVPGVGFVDIKELSEAEELEYTLSMVKSIDADGKVIPLEKEEAALYKVRYVALCVSGNNGEELSVAQALRFKRSAVQALFDACQRVNGKGKKKKRTKSPRTLDSD